ncbi:MULTISPECIES: hemolysin family protein [Phenylobacterium]|uniref:Hemolysin n=1 Tax=Phenylobacterium koreense TaxID=266125 RepID=A0ABV2EHN6_9CAUL
MILLASAVVLLLLVLNGLFAMSELAVVSSRRAKLQARAERGDKGAAAALRLSEHPTRFLAAVQVGITLIGILSGAYGQATIAGELDQILEKIPALHEYSELIATGLVVVVITYLSLIVGELVPKRFAMAFPETIAGLVARPLSLMAKAMGPFVSLLTVSTVAVLRLLGIRDEKGDRVTQEDVETVLAEGANAGLIEPEEQAMIGEVLRLGDRQVRVAMTPRHDLYWISLADTPEQQMTDIRACPYSRIVVTTGADVEEPVGVVHKKDVLDAVLDGNGVDIAALMATPLYIVESTSLLRALELLKQTPLHMALVVDEFGALQGIVTPTDLLEMIAGDFDEGYEGEGSQTIVEREDGSFLVDGRTEVDELAKTLGADFEETSHFHTAAGLVLHEIGRLPAEGDVFEIGAFRVEVIDMDDRRIDKLLFTRLDSPEGPSLAEILSS